MSLLSMAIHGRFFPFLSSSHFPTDTKDYTLNIKSTSKTLLLLSLERKKRGKEKSFTYLKKLKCDFFTQN